MQKREKAQITNLSAGHIMMLIRFAVVRIDLMSGNERWSKLFHLGFYINLGHHGWLSSFTCFETIVFKSHSPPRDLSIHSTKFQAPRMCLYLKISTEAVSFLYTGYGPACKLPEQTGGRLVK